MDHAAATIEADAFRNDLLTFYDERKRDLPWRDTGDAYQTWVSEIMLQQTRVDTVIPYYERWMRRFPSLDALARAEPDEVLHAWAGLGYYSRARNLHRAARLVRERHRGTLPGDVTVLRELPGIGEYTAGAIASIAFGRSEPAIDGNVRRVFARILDRPRPTATAIRREITRLLPHDRPGDFNQALMDLGATICTPRNPDCPACPVRRHCLARRRGTTALRPAHRPAAPAPAFDIGTAAVLDHAGRVLLVRRQSSLLEGLWSLPGQAVRGRERPSTTARRAALDFVAPAPLSRARHLTDVSHAFSHRREIYRTYVFHLHAPAPARPDILWIPPRDAATVALPAAQRRLLEVLSAR